MQIQFYKNDKRIGSYTCESVPSIGEVVMVYHNNYEDDEYRKSETLEVVKREWAFEEWSVDNYAVFKCAIVNVYLK